MDPQQELFTELITKLREAGHDVYDGFIPPEGTPYPFVYMADSQQIDEANKSAVFGSVHQTIHVWHNDPQKRGSVSLMMLEIKDICRKIERTKNFGWDLKAVDQRILHDDTTKQPLLHGLLNLEFKFS